MPRSQPQKTDQVRVLMTRTEKDLIAGRATRLGLSMSDFILRVALGAIESGTERDLVASSLGSGETLRSEEGGPF